jgi:hypothetical protein
MAGSAGKGKRGIRLYRLGLSHVASGVLAVSASPAGGILFGKMGSGGRVKYKVLRTGGRILVDLKEMEVDSLMTGLDTHAALKSLSGADAKMYEAALARATAYVEKMLASRSRLSGLDRDRNALLRDSLAALRKQVSTGQPESTNKL